MAIKKNILRLFSLLAILAVALSNIPPSPVQAHGGDGLKRQFNSGNGRLSFIGPENGKVLPTSKALGLGLAGRPDDPGMALAKRFGPEFGLKHPGQELEEAKRNQEKGGKITVKYQQKHEGVPVMAGELIVSTDEEGNLYSIHGEISPGLSLATHPAIPSGQARQTALEAIAKWYQKTPKDFIANQPELWIYDENLLQPSTRPVELVWRMEVTAKDGSLPVRELVLVNAERGSISLHFNQVDTAWTAATHSSSSLLQSSPVCSIQNGAGSGDLFFRPYVQYNCGVSFAYGVGVGDFNNDDRKDAALSVNIGPGFQHILLIFLQDNNGNLSQPVSYPAGNRSEYLAVGDLNHDGRDDVVTLDVFDETISVFLQNSSNTLNNRVIYATNSSPQAIAVGDINDDGWDDVATGGISTIGAFTQKNDGTLNAVVTYTGASTNGNDIAIGDINHDGLNDVVNMKGGGTTETLLIYLQNSSHTLNPYTSISNCVYDCGGRGIEIGDVNSDGRADLVMSFGGNGNSAKLAVFPQAGNGTLQAPIIYASKDIPTSVGIEDMDSDGKPDVVVLHSGWINAGVYTQLTNGALGAEILYPIPYKSWYYAQDIDIGDVNNDGLSDVVIADGQGLVVLYRRSPTPDTVLVVSGSNQAAPLLTQFSQPLQVKIINYLNRPVAGVTVTFTGPASGARPLFSGTGNHIATAVTGANGVAISPSFSANNIQGSYSVKATIPGSDSTADFLLANADPTIPTSISLVSGSNQAVQPQTQFSLPLKAKVTNFFGQPLSGRTVTFTAPATGASVKFSDTNNNITTATTDPNGIATSSALTSNTVVGGYLVKATVAGLGSSADFQLSNGLDVETYTANNLSSLPGTFLCNQTQQPCTINNADPHANAAHQFAIGTYFLYANRHGRNSIDNKGMTVISTVHYSSGYDNAYWSGTQMVYGDAYGFALADDVVAHELTHGVTQYESNLFYYYQSGAINESLSDLWGEYYDQVGNITAGDTGATKWLLGEDVTGLGTMRSMKNPPDYGDPDRMTSPLYHQLPYNDTWWDNGGVHHNSGVNNKAVYLMVEGGTFNGRTITALGWQKTGAIYYEASTNLLTSGADYSDLYYALQQACTNLVGQNGITDGDCAEVKDALDAVEMSGQPVAGYNPEAQLCTTTGTFPNMVFVDDLETGTGNWTFTNGASPRWQYDSPYGPYAQSGLHSLYADDYPATVTDARAQWKAISVPANAYLHFAQAYEFEFNSYGNYDGGVLEYSTNGGASWVDAGPLMDQNGYRGTIASGYSNPLANRSAFVGSSHGYISTRLNLASLAGRTVLFRWRMGLDYGGYTAGWWVDNVKLYFCGSPVLSGNAGAPGVVLSYVDGTVKQAVSGNDGSYSLSVSPSWSGTITPSHPCYTFDPPSRTYGGVIASQAGQDFKAIFNNAPECGVTVGVFRPSNGLLYLKNSNLTGYADVAINYGMGGDYPIAGDWDGDGIDTIGIYRDGAFYLRNSNTIGYADLYFPFGSPGDQPIAGDWDGDGIDTIGVYRSSDITFYLRNSNDSGTPDAFFRLGMPGDVGIAGDWDGDGRDTTGVFRPSNGIIYLKNQNTTGYADIAINYGIGGDKPVTGDWNNDGIDTIGVLRGNIFYLRNSNTVGYADVQFALGIPGDMPIAGNWDGNP